MRFTRERKRLWLAIAGSIFVHLLVAFSLAAFGRGTAPLPDPGDRPVELTLVDLAATPPPLVVEKPRYVETDPEKESAAEPKEKTFQSNANSVAQSNVPASGGLSLPSQEGKERSALEMQTQQSSVPSEGTRVQPQPTPPPPTATPVPVQTPAPTPKPKPKPTAPPKPTPLPEPIATPEPDRLAMLTGTPPPAILNPDDVETTSPPKVEPTINPALARPRPERPATAYQPEKQETRIRGRITDRGPSAVDAVATPLGRYNKIVSDAVGSLWYRYTKEKRDMTSVGTAVLEAEVDSEGKVRNLRVVSNTANESFANICLQSFQEAQIPPIPPDLVQTLPDERLQVTFSFTMYAN